MTIKPKDTFIDWVETHERAWGQELYRGRPSLHQIMHAQVVTFWMPTKPDKQMRYVIRLFQELKEIEMHLTRLVLRSAVETPSERLIRIYVGQKRYLIQDVRIVFKPADNE